MCESDMEIGDAVNEKKKKKSRFTEFNPDTDFAVIEFRFGMVFPTVEHFRKVVKEYAIMSKKKKCAICYECETPSEGQMYGELSLDGVCFKYLQLDFRYY